MPLISVFGRRVHVGTDVSGVLVSGSMARMAAPTTRDRILEALQDLPADATVDAAIERLVFLAKIDAGLAELDEGKGLHEEVKQRLGM